MDVDPHLAALLCVTRYVWYVCIISACVVPLDSLASGACMHAACSAWTQMSNLQR